MLIAYLDPEDSSGKRHVYRVEAVTNDDLRYRDNPDIVYVLEANMPSDQVRTLWTQCTRFYLKDKFAGIIDEDYDIPYVKK